jgi:dTDP-4-dehydrorhamnose 3,5-epimerase
MRYRPTRLDGAFLVEPEPHEDERGFFARLWDGEDFSRHGLDPAVAQISMSYNRRAGTLRGLHFQYPPHEETKLVRCTRGALYDVIVDLRQGSPTYLAWEGFTLTDANRLQLYVPKGFAHGFLTLADETEVFYLISTPYAAGSYGGLRWDDKRIGVAWPRAVAVIAERDRTFPDFPGTSPFTHA